MDEPSNRKQQNQSFLRELEKQRLNKPCQRVIDLRGKVAGECQLYEFGDRQHYLDDRAYLLVKQLMARFNGRYTVGVYEAVLKALKKLQQTVSEPTTTASSPQLLRVDELIQRQERRVIFSTPVRLRLADVLYNGHTIDMAASSLRVTLKRSHSLHRGDILQVEFVESADHPVPPALRSISYQIIKLDHDLRSTTVVLSRHHGDQETELALQHWLETHAQQRQEDIDNELINIQIQLVLRLWLSHLSQLHLWLGDSSLPQPLLALHLMPPAYTLMQLWQPNPQRLLEQLPLIPADQYGLDQILLIDGDRSYTALLTQPSAVLKLLRCQPQNGDSRLFLLRCHPVSFAGETIRTNLDELKQTDAAHAAMLQQQLAQIKQHISLLDMSPLLSNTSTGQSINSSQLGMHQCLQSFLKQPPAPKRFCSHIQRDRSRFYIQTPVTAHLNGKRYSRQTLDVSANGLALTLPADVSIHLQQRIYIDFDRWHNLTEKVKLTSVPYLVKNKLLWNGETRLGLERISNNCPESLNQFFDWVIAQNRESLKSNHTDVIDAIEGRIFSQGLLTSLGSSALFLGLDEEYRRQLALATATAANAVASWPAGLWQALQQQVASLSELLKQAPHDTPAVVTGIYAYCDAEDRWSIVLEQDFQGSRDKALFIQRGLAAPHFKAFHCVLTPLSGKETELETDLMAQLWQYRQRHAHRVKQIRQQLTQLFGMAELSDVSDVFRILYSV